MLLGPEAKNGAANQFGWHVLQVPRHADISSKLVLRMIEWFHQFRFPKAIGVMKDD